MLGCLIAVKPKFLVAAALLALAGWWTTALAAAACAGFLSLLPLVVYGPGVYLAWWRVAGVVPAGAGAPFNASLAAMLARLGALDLALPAGAILLAALAWWAWRRRPDQLTLLGARLVSGILASPVGWEHYVLFALPLFFRRRWSPATWAAAGLLLVPATVQGFWSESSPPTEQLASVGALALLLLLADLVATDVEVRWRRLGIPAV